MAGACEVRPSRQALDMAGAVAGVGVLVGVVSQAARGNNVVSEASEEELKS